MRVTRLSIENFRGIAKAELYFSGHTLLIGGNNVGKSTICEALDLVLGPDRLSRTPLQPLRLDLQGQNYRSPNSEIVAFANDMLLGVARGAPYQGVSRFNFRANADKRDAAIRSAVGIAIRTRTSLCAV